MSEYSEAEQMERAKGWLKTNGIWIIAGIAIGAGGLGGYRWYEERRNVQAETASARYEELVDAFSRKDNARGMTLLRTDEVGAIQLATNGRVLLVRTATGLQGSLTAGPLQRAWWPATPLPSDPASRRSERAPRLQASPPPT